MPNSMFAIPFGIDGWSKLFWIFIGLILAGILGWIIRGLFGGRSGASTTTQIANRMVKVEEPVTEVADQLEAVEGVGPDIAALFHEHGVHRFAQVAAMKPADIQKLLDTDKRKFSLARPLSWPFQSNLLANGQLAAFALVVSKLKDGIIPTAAIEGVGPAMERKLAAVEVASVETLAAHNPAELSAKLRSTGENVTEDRIGGWIGQARAMVDGDHRRLAEFMGLGGVALGAYSGRTVGTTSRIAERKLAEAITVENAAPAVGWWAGPWWPLLLGLIGLLLLALLCALHIWCPRMPAPVVPVTETRIIQAPGASHYEALNRRLDTDTMFDTNKSTLKPEGQTAINEKLDALKGFMPVSIMITGHADVRGTPEANLKLSKQRADAVAAFITAQIPTHNPGRRPSMQAYGAGEQYPDPKADTPDKCAAMLKADAKSAETDACLAPDRRVEVTLFAERPGGSAAPEGVAAPKGD